MNHERLNPNKIKFLDWDSRFFGFSIGRMHAVGLTEELLRKILENSREKKIRFVELFCDVSDWESIHAAEILAFQLVDWRLTFKKNLSGDFLAPDMTAKELTFKKAGPEDIADLKTIGQGLFTSSRYYRYPGFDRNKVDGLFQLWIEKAVTGEFDDELYYLSDESGILAFNSFKYNDRENAASIGLFAVNEAHRGKGLGSLLLNRGFHLLHNRRVTVVTQGRNFNAVHLYQKNGFHLTNITPCYYKWLGAGTGGESQEK